MSTFLQLGQVEQSYVGKVPVGTVNLQRALCQLSETQTFINKGEREPKFHFKINNVDFNLECANRIDMSLLNKHTSQLCQLCFWGQQYLYYWVLYPS